MTWFTPRQIGQFSRSMYDEDWTWSHMWTVMLLACVCSHAHHVTGVLLDTLGIPRPPIRRLQDSPYPLHLLRDRPQLLHQ